jgi:hypothetical protein
MGVDVANPVQARTHDLSGFNVQNGSTYTIISGYFLNQKAPLYMKQPECPA